MIEVFLRGFFDDHLCGICMAFIDRSKNFEGNYCYGEGRENVRERERREMEWENNGIC